MATTKNITFDGKNYTYIVQKNKETSPTNASVYKGEYGVVFLIEGNAKKISEKIAQELNSPPITPHITLGQGRYSTQKSLLELKKITKKIAATTKKIPISLSRNLSNHTSGNTFWNVEKGKEKLHDINKYLCDKGGPVEPMWQIVNDPNANLALVRKYGRDFNVPGLDGTPGAHNNPHITVAYGKHAKNINTKLSEKIKALDHLSLSKIAIFKIDCVGNLVGSPIQIYDLGKGSSLENKAEKPIQTP